MNGLIDELRLLRTYYFLGMYNEVLHEASRLTGDLANIGQIWALRAQIEMDPAKLSAAIPDSDSPDQNALKLYAVYMSGDRAVKDQVVQHVTSIIQNQDVSGFVLFQLYCGYIFLAENNVRDALLLSNMPGDSYESTFEKYAQQVLCYLKLNRTDLAQPVLNTLERTDDDDVQGQLCKFWILLQINDTNSLSQAAQVVQELTDRVSINSVTLTLQGVLYLAEKKQKEAFNCFKQARDLNLQHYNFVREDVLVNTMCAVFQRGAAASNDTIIAKVMAELAQFHPNAAFLEKKAELEHMFDAYSAQFA